ncbi:helix-turn-helix domain-containing protein [Bradyrhizobium roseum]|uniref:helix-turn-helix domain-containing protein n=1 Tax=Bradyrhizobium roseum TaxID=3056648 RepID=UPI0026110FF5|nr:helix-turn-helix domain-containing protein [Bradyrhizobium roseus]WKA28807.1 helix-turn-helix domain-containing protein [Bradyrhizobium roseus]
MIAIQKRNNPLSNYPVMYSSDPDLVRDRLFGFYKATHFDIARQKSEFAVRANHLQIGGLGLSYCDYANDVTVGFGEDTFVRQIFNLQGEGQYTAGGRSAEIRGGKWTAVLPASTPLRLDFKAHYCQFVLRIEMSALLSNLGILIGQPVSRELVFDQTGARDPAMAALRRRVFDFANDFNARGAFFTDRAAAEVERMVIMKFLMCHQHSYTDLLLREPLPAGSSAVRKVEEFIAANWDKPLDIEKMAALAQVSARSLFRQFKKDRGCTPAEFAKGIRLDHARDMLQRCDAEISVTQIALKCGFQNPGHFARDYRLAFGELPSETLKRGRLPPHLPQ